MYSFITQKPSSKDIKIFNMQEYQNENFISFKVDPRMLSNEQKQLLITNYQLDEKISNYQDYIFLAFPLVKKEIVDLEESEHFFKK